jgi:hypothetical protein
MIENDTRYSQRRQDPSLTPRPPWAGSDLRDEKYRARLIRTLGAWTIRLPLRPRVIVHSPRTPPEPGILEQQPK